MKIRNKLTYKFVLIVASLLLLFSLVIYFFTRQYREQQFDKRLVDKGLTTAKLLIQIDEVDVRLLKIIDRNNLTALNNEKVTVYNEAGVEIYSSDDEPRVPVSKELWSTIKKQKTLFFNYGKEEAVGVIYPYKDQQYVVIVSALDTFGWKKIGHLKNLLIISYIASIIIIFLAGWFFSAQALMPISEIVNEVNSISATNLNSRVKERNGQDEIAQLAITFNRMLERLHHSFQTQKSFVSNASHELRTPLTSIKAQLQVVLMNERDKSQYQHVLKSVLQDVDGLVHLSNGLLKLAHADSWNIISKSDAIRIDELLLTCIGEMNKKFINQTIHFNLKQLPDDDKDFIFRGDEVMIKTAILNILDNACKYASGSPVYININLRKNDVEIEIRDNGEGIDINELDNIFEPFYRGSNVRNFSGNGIGLSLTRSIIQAHGGNIKVDSKIGKGTCVTISFPTLDSKYEVKNI